MALESASGCGRSSSSTSNLSALAPPFTVDRYNQNPVVKFTDMPYAAGTGAGAAPFGHTWEYHPSDTRLEVFREPGLNVDGSTRTTCMPLSNECRYSVTESVNPSNNTQWSGLNNPVVSTPMSSNDYRYPPSESVNPPYTQWSGVNKPGVSTPMLSSDYRYSVSDSVNQSGTQWSVPPFGNNWQYHSPHTSETRPEVFPKPKLDVGKSTRTTSMPLSDVYEYSLPESVDPSSTQWSGLNPGVKFSTNTFYVAEVEPYCPAYVPPMVTEDSPKVALGESGYRTLSSSRLVNASSSQVDYAKSLSGLEYVPQWGGAFNGLTEEKWGKQVDYVGSFSSEKVNDGTPPVYKNYMSQDAAVKSSDAFGGDSGVSYRKSTDGIGRKGFIGSFSVKDGNDKSLFAQELGSGISYGKSTDGIGRKGFIGSFSVKDGNDKSLFAQELGSGISYGKSTDGFGQEGCAGSLSVGNVNDETIYAQTLGFLPFKSSGAQFLGSSSSFSESRPPEACQESSKNVFNYQKKYGPNERFIQPLDPFVQDSGLLVKPSPAVVIRAPVNDTSSPARDLVTRKNVSTGSVTNACKKSDSPKPSKAKETHILSSPNSIEGSFNASQLDAGEELSSKPPYVDLIDTTLKIKSAPRVTDTRVLPGSLSLDNNHAFKYTENPSDSLDNHYPAEDSPCWKGAPASQYSFYDVLGPSIPCHFAKELDGSYDLDENGNNVAPRGNDPIRSPSQKPSEANANKKIGCTGNDVASSPKSTFNSSCPTKEHRSVDGGLNFNDASEGAAVAYHAAENVLCSPSAQENSVQDQPASGREETPQMDVSTLINAIHNLSELLRFSCSADSIGLKEHDQEVLAYVISNLDACMSKKSAKSTPAPEPMFSQQEASINTGELHDLHPDKCADQPQQRYRGTGKSYGQCDHQLMHTEKTTFSESSKKGEYRPYFLPLLDDLSTSCNKDMVQAMKTILHENFNFEGEMQSESLLFKNLWLEAEAKLCSIGYRARFDRMRNQMDKYELNRRKGDVGNLSGSNYSPDLKVTSAPASQAEDGSMAEGTIADHSTFSTNNHVDDVEASILTRYNTLRRRDDKSNLEEQHQPHMIDTRKAEGQFGSFLGGFDLEDTVTNRPTFRKSPADNMDSPVLARFNMIRCRDDNSNAEEHQQLNIFDTRKAEGQFGSLMGGFVPEGTIINHSTVMSTPTDDVESAVLARFNILRCRGDKSNHEEHLHPNMVEATESEAQFGSSTSGFDPESTIINPSTLSTNSPVDDVESSVLARYNMLRCRDDKYNPEPQQQPDMVDSVEAEGQFGSSVGGFDPEGSITNHSTFSTNNHADDVQASVLARFNILKCRDDKSNSEEQLSDAVDNRKAEGQYASYIDASGYASMKESHLCVTSDPVSRADRHGRFGDQILPGWYDNSSSDWEHVLKDDFTWQK